MLNPRRIFLLLIASSHQLGAIAQDTAIKTPDKAGFMRSEGKIYVVVAVILTIFSGLIIYVARLDRKITRLEKRENI